MGYTVTVQVADKELRAKALKFMQEHYREWGVIGNNPQWESHARGPLPGPELSYDRSPLRIGWDYSCLNDPERHYIWCLLRWMALTFGSTRKWKGSDKEYPYYIYDGGDKSPVLVGDNWKNRPQSIIDEGWSESQSDGWAQWSFMHRPEGKKWVLSILKMVIRSTWELHPKQQEKLIRAELARLTEEWKKVA